MHADDAASRPVGELRVRTRLEGVRAEDRPARIDRGIEPVGHVEEAEWRLCARLAYRDLARADEASTVPELESPRAAINHEPLVDGPELERGRTHPPRSAVRPPGNGHAVPGGLTLVIAESRERQDELGAEVGPELVQGRDAPRPRARPRADDHLSPRERPRPHDVHVGAALRARRGLRRKRDECDRDDEQRANGPRRHDPPLPVHLSRHPNSSEHCRRPTPRVPRGEPQPPLGLLRSAPLPAKPVKR